MSNAEHDRIRGNDAKALLNNPILKEALGKVREYLDSKELSCDPQHKNFPELSARIVTSKQLLAGIEREIMRIIEDGKVAQVKIDQIEAVKTKKSMFRR